MAIQFKSFDDIEEALFAHKKITGYGFFEDYENHKASVLRLAETMRDSDWMLDEVTGRIYYVCKVPDGLRILNRLSLSACMDDSLFQRVTIEDNVILVSQPQYKRNETSRRALAAKNFIVTTGMVPTTCAPCIRLEDCSQWANFTKHDEHAPIRCERFTTDVAVLKAEAEALAKVKTEMAEADRLDPPPL